MFKCCSNDYPSSTRRMLAATTKLGLLARFLAVLTAVLAVRTVLRDHAVAAGVGAFIRVSHKRITSRSLYAPEGSITTPAPARPAAGPFRI